MMRVMMMMMMLSAASARKLKGGRGDWGVLDCGDFVICMPEELTGGKTVRTNTTIHNGQPSNEWGHLADRKAYCGAYGQIGNGVDVTVEFYLDDVLVHKGRYQQNHCILQAGAVTTADPNADVKEGSWSGNNPGVVRIRALGAVMIVNNCKHDITMTRASTESWGKTENLVCDNENIIKLEKDSQKFVMFTGMSFFTLGGIPTETGEDVFILDNQGTTVKFSQATYDDEFGQFLPVMTYAEVRSWFPADSRAVKNCEPYTESIFFSSYMLGYDNEVEMRNDLLPANTPARVGLRYLKLCGA